MIFRPDIPRPTCSGALVEQLKQFLLELGRDFCFIGSQYPVQVGGRDFALDLLFFNRALNCLVAFELKVVEFEPEHLGKLQFYLEALDRDVKKPHEQPSIGVLLCATKNNEVVEYALSRSMSPALVAEYQTRLPDKKLLQAKLHEFYALAQSQAEADAGTEDCAAARGKNARRLRRSERPARRHDRTLPQEAHRSRPAPRRDQQGQRREKSIRHGHPSTLHLWWARRPLAAARAVIFAQMVDDPSAHPDLFPTEKAQEKERQRLFRIIEDLVLWENTTNETVLQTARDEIWQSWRYTCAENADHPRAKELFDRYKLPAFHDPFAGGGSIPLEAQRLGLESYASDLNPVAVLINKAMIEIPPKFAGKPPVNPDCATRSAALQEGVEGSAGAGRGRALLWEVDARRGREAHRPPLSQGRGHGGDGEGAAGPEELCGTEAHRDCMALGAYGEEPEPGLRACGRAARVNLHALHKAGQGSLCRASDRGRRIPLHGEGGQAEGRRGGEERHQVARGRNFHA